MHPQVSLPSLTDLFTSPWSMLMALFHTITRLLGFGGGSSTPAAGPAGGDPLVPFGFNSTLPGTGAMCSNGQKIRCNYTGKLLNGKQFDSSIGRAPFEFTLGVGQVIKCWDKGLAMMKEG